MSMHIQARPVDLMGLERSKLSCILRCRRTRCLALRALMAMMFTRLLFLAVAPCTRLRCAAMCTDIQLAGLRLRSLAHGMRIQLVKLTGA